MGNYSSNAESQPVGPSVTEQLALRVVDCMSAIREVSNACNSLATLNRNTVSEINKALADLHKRINTLDAKLTELIDAGKRQD